MEGRFLNIVAEVWETKINFDPEPRTKSSKTLSEKCSLQLVTTLSILVLGLEIY